MADDVSTTYLPLTTTFTAPADCGHTPYLTGEWTGANTQWFVAPGGDRTSCFPPAFPVDEMSLVYSPGICPAGWASACDSVVKVEEQLGNLSFDDEDTRDILMMLGSFDMPAYILNRKTPYHRLWARYNLGLPGIEEESGLPCSLIDLLAQLDHPGIIEALFAWQVPKGHLVQKYSWDATRYAAIIRALEDSKAANELDLATSLLARGTSLVSLVHSLLSLVEQCLLHVPPGSNHFKQTLMFPLVMAASQRNYLSAHAKDFICSTLESLAVEGNYYLRQGVLRIVRDHWANDADTIEETARRLGIELAMW
jgi:hypothetical protein